MDGRSQSAGETRSRYLFWRQGLPVPDLQFEVRGLTGYRCGRLVWTDLALPTVTAARFRDLFTWETGRPRKPLQGPR
jgi:hypothetical protein